MSDGNNIPERENPDDERHIDVSLFWILFWIPRDSSGGTGSTDDQLPMWPTLECPSETVLEWVFISSELVISIMNSEGPPKQSAPQIIDNGAADVAPFDFRSYNQPRNSRTEGMLKLEIPNFPNLRSKISTEFVYIGNLPWLVVPIDPPVSPKIAGG